MDHPAMRVSDEEREETVELLRTHMLAGRITSDELDDRVGEVWAAHFDSELDHAMRGLPDRRPPYEPPTFVVAPTEDSSGMAAMVVGIVSLLIFAMSFSLLGILTLPGSITAWVLGRSALRSNPQDSKARAGLVLGVIGTALACLQLASCAAILT